MKKKLKKLLAIVVAFATFATSGIVPMTASAEDETYTTEYDTITLADLKDGDGNSVVGDDPNNITLAQSNYTYDGTSSTHSVIFKFGVELSISSGNDLKIALDDMYNEAATLQMSSDNIRAWVGSNNRVKYDPITSGTHEIEIGRLRVVTGDNAGKDYVYYKIDGTLLHEAYAELNSDGKYTTYGGANYTPAYVVGFATANTPNQCFYEIEEETGPYTSDYDTITLADLKDGDGNSVVGDDPNNITLAQSNYTYDGTSSTHSVIFKFGVELSISSGNDLKIALDDMYNEAATLQMSSDNIRAWVGSNNRVKYDPITSGTHEIEIGRLRVVTGDNAGKDYVYYKIDGIVLHEAYAELNSDGQYTTYGGANYTPAYVVGFATANTPNQRFYEIEEEAAEEFTDDYDTVTIEQLGTAGTDGVYSITAGAKSYEGTSATHSVVVKFGYEPVGDSIDWQLTLDKNWNASCMTYFKTNETVLYVGEELIHVDAITSGKHDIEFGRLRVTAGENAGKDYVYLKIDKELAASGYTDFYQTEGGYSDGYGGTATLSYVVGLPASGVATHNYYEFESVAEEFTDDYDTVTLADLGLVGTDWETTIEPGAKSYEGTSATHSVVVKFGWEPNDLENNDWQLTLDKNWNAKCMVWFKSDGTYLAAGGDGYIKTDAITSGQHEVEFGRLRVTAGSNAGKDYVFLKIDGEVVSSDYTDLYQTEGGYSDGYDGTATLSYVIGFPSQGTKVQSFSGFGVDNTEKFTDDYDTVTLADLGLIGTDWETTVEAGERSYAGTSSTYSVIVKFGWAANIDTTSTPEIDFKIALDTNWNEKCMVWFKSDYVRTYIGDASSIKTTAITSGQHDVEFGRLRVVNGENTGKDYVYLKIDNTVVASGYTDYYQTDGGYVYAGSNTTTPAYKVCFPTSGTSVQGFSGFAEQEEYEAYDEIEYADLMVDGEKVGPKTTLNSESILFTYNRTSPTGSAILKYRWKVGSVTKFQLSFEHTVNTSGSNEMAYLFGAQLDQEDNTTYPNGRMYFRPGYGSKSNLPTALATGTTHDVEFARLKVATGANTGKYYVYLKIDGVMVAEDYVAADVVDSNGDYTTNPYTTTNSVLSGEIFLAFFGSDENSISAYGQDTTIVQVGTRGDFDGDGVIDATEFATLISILLGRAAETTEGIADYNNDSKLNACDIVAMKKQLSYVNTYSKSESLTFGIQEHLLADESKTAEYIADASVALGADAYRLSKPLHELFTVTSANIITVKSDAMTEMKGLIAELKAKGVTEFLYVSSTFVYPYGYRNENNHDKTVPDPTSETEEYMLWLSVNAAAYKKLSEEVPEIKFFEPFNEINLIDSRLEKNGIGWDSTETEQENYRFTVAEKAGIMADLCWNVTNAVKSVDTTNQVTTPSVSVATASTVESDFLDAFYTCIETGAYPRNMTLGDKRIDNFFTIVNLHLYPDYDEAEWYENQDTINENMASTWASRVSSAYTSVIQAHNDGGSRVWITETGMASKNSGGSMRDEDTVADIIGLVLNQIDTNLTYIDAVFFYEIADNGNTVLSGNGSEDTYGFFYASDSAYGTAYAVKPIAKTVYSFFHNSSTDYSAINSFVSKYAGN